MLSDSRFGHLAGLFTGADAGIDEAALPPEAAEAFRRGGGAFGKFVVLDELGRGGTSVVYRAWQADLRREVALKVVSGLNPELRSRFLREARVGASLSHPGILPVYEVGEGGGALWLAMPRVEGKTLDACELGPEAAAEAVGVAARTLEAAHADGIVHRDLKPRNIMREASGAVIVMDFGLALTREETTRISVTGQVLGTPSYMAPEQAAGGTADARTDVYGLGATLYRLVSGRAPYEQASLQECLAAIAAGDPAPPSAHAPVPAALETVILKAMDRDPARRYPTAAALADDLDRFRRSEPIHGRRPPAAIRASRALRRHPLATAAAITAILALAAYGVGARMSKRDPSPGPPATAPENPEYERARKLRNAGNTRAALDVYRSIAAADPNDAAAWRECAACRIALGLPAEAAADLARVHALLPKDGMVLRQRAQCLLSASDPAAALVDIDKALALSPGLPEFLFTRATIYSALKKYDLALADSDAAIAADPTVPLAYLYRSSVRYGAGRYADAVEDCTEALRLGGNRSMCLASRARAQLRAGDPKGALQDFRDAAEADPTSAQRLAVEIKEAEARVRALEDASEGE